MAATMPASKMPSAKSAAPMWPIQRLERFGELRALKIGGVDAVMKQRHRGENRGDGEHGSEQRAEKSIEAAGTDVARLHAFVHDGALLEEKHPGRDGGADGGEDQQKNLVAAAAGERRPGEHRVADGVPIGTRQNCGGNKKAVEDREAQRDSFPGPIAAGGDRGDDDDERSADGDGRANAEEAEAGAHADEFRDEGEKISENQIAHGEEAPEFSEAIEDQFGVAAMGDGAEAHRHFLHDETHDEGENDEGNEEADAEARAVGGVGKHAGGIVFAEEDENAGADQKPEQAEAAESFGPRPFHRARATSQRSRARSTSSWVTRPIKFRSCGGRDGGFRGRMGRLASELAGIFCRERP